MALTTIDLGLKDLLRDPERRHEFFKSITQDEIASQIKELRKKRDLTQQAFAELAEMKQSAVSRIEKSDYSSWTLTTLFRVAGALNARWKLILEPIEDAVSEIERLDEGGNAHSPIGPGGNSFIEAQSGRGTIDPRRPPEGCLKYEWEKPKGQLADAF